MGADPAAADAAAKQGGRPMIERVRTLRAEFGLSLAAAKAVVDATDGRPPQFPAVASAEELKSVLGAELGSMRVLLGVVIVPQLRPPRQSSARENPCWTRWTHRARVEKRHLSHAVACSRVDGGGGRWDTHCLPGSFRRTESWLVVAPLCWLFPSAARLGWLTARVPNPTPERARGVVCLFRGNGTLFSPGFGRLCARLRAGGFWTEDLRCVGDRWVCQYLATERPAGPVVLIGHSRGGRRALVAATRLGQLGIAVDLVVCVDVAFPPPVPASVRRAVHLFRSGWRIYPARPLRPAEGATGLVENLDLDRPEAPFPGTGLHHLNITACPALHDWIVGQVVQAAGPVSPAPVGL